MRRTIAVVTTSRADYSLLYWPLKDMASHPDLDVKIIAMGSHLSPEFGCTIQEIERDGFHVDLRVECLLSSDSDIGMAKTIGVATLSLAESLGQMRPDLLVLTADRYEMLAPASVALALRIPIAHIEGGEISEGAIDDSVRNALTKLSHIHFTSTETARARVISMGEEDWRVHRVGAPALDHLRRATLLSREEIGARLALDLTRPSAVVTFHPVTIARDTTREADAFFAALRSVSGQILFCYPNADAGSRALIDRVKAFAVGRANTRVFVSLEPIVYWSLLQHVDLLLGNSSSGIIEAASLGLAVVNVGIRQRGRERGHNVVDAEAVTDQILDRVATAQSQEFRRSLKGMANLYGDGCASRRIVDVLTSVKLGEELLIKRAPSR
jgi:UDP-N-acetylglucosamine 2-epimerase (non-hydrolysing)/GDP/UDP-N,N'-diacetylbacillosamine 2-epimerase (hydrolysing)